MDADVWNKEIITGLDDNSCKGLLLIMLTLIYILSELHLEQMNVNSGKTAMVPKQALF